MLVYTSITKNYLPKARVLAKSVKYFHPDWTFVLMCSDTFPTDFDLEQEPFDEVLTIEQLDIPYWKSWAFGHALVELCTAVKGPAASLLARRVDVDKIMYIDPDIKVFSSLEQLDKWLDEDEILLTPHLLDPERDIDAIIDNEISALKHGIYNLGFFAAKTSGQGLDFIDWWAERLRTFCRDDIPGGLFTDQRWCDLAPAFFSGLKIVRDRGYNVATWNIAHRELSKDDFGNFLVANVPLRFYHFTGYDSGDGFGMLMRYAASQTVAHELWDMYGKDLAAEGNGDPNYHSWHYGQFENGVSIPIEVRKLYQSREDLQNEFPDPYQISEPSLYNWWQKETVHSNISDTTIPECDQYVEEIGQPKRTFVKKVARAFELIRDQGLGALILRLRN
jgi:hypothetical protein